MDREWCCDCLLGCEQAREVTIDFTHQAVCTRCGYTITTGVGRRRANKMVTFLNGKDKERVALVDPISSETVKELPKSLIISRQLLYIICFARSTSRMNLACNAMLIVCVRDITERDWYS